jgi:putative GTP pyrophosphokinase
VAGMLIRQDDIKLIKMKDYIEQPKPNGYRSLHLIVEVPVFFADKTRKMRVEVQIRTIAMDFWASLDHHLRYKKDVKDAASIEKELKRCADVISKTDEDMLRVRKRIFADTQVLETKDLWK